MPPEAPTTRIRAPRSDLLPVEVSLSDLLSGLRRPSGVEPTDDGDEACRRRPVGCVRGEVQVRDPTVAVDDDIGTELQRVVTGAPPDPLACDDRSDARCHHAGAEEPERQGPPRAERLVERALGIGNDDRAGEG